jgi:AcrR family transcriptional regulator
VKRSTPKATPTSSGRPRNPSIDAAVMKVALELFLEHGVEGVSFEQIAKRTGVARATIYRRWSKREDLLADALQSVRSADAQNPSAIECMSTNDLLNYLADIFTDYLVKPQSRKLFSRLVGTLASHPKLMSTYRQRSTEPLWNAICGVVERGRLDGSLPDAPPADMLRTLLLGAVYYRTIMRSDTPELSHERQWVEDLMRCVGLPLHTS